jgi:hypothetical protein
MPKAHNTHKQSKKQPLLTPKEKKAAKIAKKHHEESPTPFLPH